MNLKTGKVWGDEYKFPANLQDFVYRDELAITVAVPKDYVNQWESGYKCEKESCFMDGCVECHIPENKNLIEHLCFHHAFKSGYCFCCGEFYGDDNNFMSGNSLCDNCKWAGDYDNAD